MTKTDRAFHLLASESPEAFRQLIDLVLPQLLPAGASIEPEDLDESRLDIPAAIDADLVARVGPSDLLHVEFQGYRDSTFTDRLFRYHLLLVLRYPERRVRTIALFLTRPSAAQRKGTIARAGVTVHVTPVVLPELPASLLLAREQTACFAPAADAEGRSDEELCALVAQSLAENHASRTQKYMAVVAAITHGRYDQMVSAMQELDLEPVIIEDLVRFGMDQGFERGLEQGLEQGRGEALEEVRRRLRETLHARGLPCVPDQDGRLEGEQSLAKLLSWLARAGSASSVQEILDG